MKKILIVALTFAAAQLLPAADVTGKVVLKGTPPPERVIEPLQKDANCGKLRTDVPKTRLYVLGASGELADVLVYLSEGVAEKKYDVPAKEVVLDQTGCEYVPYVFAMQTGQKLVIKNSDPTLHNILASPKSNRPFNEAQMGKGPDKVKTFDKPEMFVSFQCSIHPWMFSYGSILDHPYFAVTGKDGSFKLVNVPPGKYKVEARHRKAGTATKEITVGNDTQNVDFTLELK